MCEIHKQQGLIIRLILGVMVLCVLLSCEPQRHCDHHFVYIGTILRTVSRHVHRDYKLCFTSLDQVIFKDHPEIMIDTLLIPAGMNYEYKGSFYTLCESDEDAFEKMAQIKYRLIYGNEVISSGYFYIENLQRQYIDSTHTTILQIPVIEIPRNY